MTRYLLDTNIVSEVVRPTPSPNLIGWLSVRNDHELNIAALTLAEIRRGVLLLPTGRKRDQLEAWFSGPEGPPAFFLGRVLPFDAAAAVVWAEMMARGSAQGRPRSALDAIIAATAIANGCVLVTANDKDFDGLALINPLRPDP